MDFIRDDINYLNVLSVPSDYKLTPDIVIFLMCIPIFSLLLVTKIENQ